MDLAVQARLENADFAGTVEQGVQQLRVHPRQVRRLQCQGSGLLDRTLELDGRLSPGLIYQGGLGSFQWNLDLQRGLGHRRRLFFDGLGLLLELDIAYRLQRH